MLSNSPVCATIGVKDIALSKEFYEGKLGLKPSADMNSDEYKDGLFYDCSSGTKLFVYTSAVAGNNQTTSATWGVQDVKAEVDALKAKGISFEHYDMPDVTMEGDVHVWGNMRSAWFKDPDGNILNISSM
jgi:catechol 2,3-dioxygenase-like lactoylglutathione lyase family enzyme